MNGSSGNVAQRLVDDKGVAHNRMKPKMDQTRAQLFIHIEKHAPGEGRKCWLCVAIIYTVEKLSLPRWRN